jgi:nicotinic acid mononucleotide adenylyltransferase
MGCFGAVEDAFTHDVAVRVCPLELCVPRALSSFQLLFTLSQLFQDWKFDLIIGGDLVPSLSRWAHAPSLLRHVSFICVPRPGHEGALHAAMALGLGLEPEVRIRFLRHGRASMVATMLISSTEIRKRLRAAWTRVKHLQDGTVRDHVDLMRSHRARATQTLLPGPAAARVLRYRQFADL